jgi:hypothetical protein
MKPEEFGKWLESWVTARNSGGISAEPDIIPLNRVIPGDSDSSRIAYNLYDDKEWLTISWGLIR